MTGREGRTETAASEEWNPAFMLAHDYGVHHMGCEMIEALGRNEASENCTCGFKEAVAASGAYVAALSVALEASRQERDKASARAWMYESQIDDERGWRASAEAELAGLREELRLSLIHI